MLGFPGCGLGSVQGIDGLFLKPRTGWKQVRLDFGGVQDSPRSIHEMFSPVEAGGCAH